MEALFGSDVRRAGRMKIVRTTGRRYRPAEVLFTTPPWDVYQDEGYDGDIPCFTPDHRVDWFAIHPLKYPEMYHPSVKGRAMDMAFLAANVPGPTYLEVPAQRRIIEELGSGKFKVLALSCYTWTLPWAMKLARRAREEFGVEEVWLGNYGVMTPEPRLEQCFDRLFAGYAEHLLRDLFGLSPLGPAGLVHPDLTVHSTYCSKQIKVGHLIYERGCAQNCTFCADPVFQPGGEAAISLEAVRQAVEHYREVGCSSIHLVNQDVRPFSRTGKEVVKLLKEYRLPFTMMASFQAIMAKGKEGLAWLREMGCTMVQPGIESLDDANLEKHRKTTDVGNIERSVAMLDEARIRLSATYMICFEHDTADSIRRAQKRLGDLGPIYTYFSIIQPMPGTPFYADLERRGLINDYDWRKWTNGYLVWKHPTISPEEARELLFEMDQTVNTPHSNPALAREWKRLEALQRRLEEQAAREAQERPALRSVPLPAPADVS